MILQLNPPIPLNTTDGKGLAHFLIDYGIEHDLVWVVFLEDGEIWCFLNKDVRSTENVSIGRNLPTTTFVQNNNETNSQLMEELRRSLNSKNKIANVNESQKLKRV